MTEDPKCKYNILNIYTGTQIGTISGHCGSVTKICTYKPEDNRIVSTSEDKCIFVWNLSKKDHKITGFNISAIRAHEGPISDCSLSRVYGSFTTSSHDKRIKLWDLNMQKCVRTYKGHAAEVVCVTLDEEEQRIISGSKDKSVRLWDIYSNDRWKNTTAHLAPVTCVTAMQNTKINSFISASESGELLQWDLYKWIPKRQYKGHESCINSVSVSLDSDKMVVGGNNKKLTIWDIGDYKEYERFIVKGTVRSVSINPLHYIFAVGEEENIKMFHFSSTSPYQTIVPTDIKTDNPPNVTTLCWSDNSKNLYAGYSDGKIRVYRFKKFYIPWHMKKFRAIRKKLNT